jgi:hypothetical protein
MIEMRYVYRYINKNIICHLIDLKIDCNTMSEKKYFCKSCKLVKINLDALGVSLYALKILFETSFIKLDLLALITSKILFIHSTHEYN